MRSNDAYARGNSGPQFPLGATSSEAEMEQQLDRSPLKGPGAIVGRMGLQFQLPRAQTDAEVSRDMHGID